MNSHVPKTWLANHLLKWHKLHGRHNLPWKHPLSPYRVWVSEVMLQQTQVSTVIPYFEKFMQSFPTINVLANASIESVLHHWAGLGYYARGRNLHKCAQYIVGELGGQWPQTVEALLSLPGIGLSTAGAIIAQAFNRRATICDGNVKRVLSRFHRLQGPLGQKDVEKKLWALAQYYTPSKQVADYTQAIMDIGATLCTRTKPRCLVCPLQEACLAYKTDEPTNYPQRSKRKAIPLRQKWMGCIINHQQEILLEQRPTQGIWGGLWSLPEFDKEESLDLFVKTHGKNFQSQTLSQLKHTFTHFRLLIIPKVFKFKRSFFIKDKFLWVNAKTLTTLGLPTPIQKIVNYDIIRQNMSSL